MTDAAEASAVAVGDTVEFEYKGEPTRGEVVKVVGSKLRVQHEEGAALWVAVNATSALHKRVVEYEDGEEEREYWELLVRQEALADAAVEKAVEALLGPELANRLHEAAEAIIREAEEEAMADAAVERALEASVEAELDGMLHEATEAIAMAAEEAAAARESAAEEAVEAALSELLAWR